MGLRSFTVISCLLFVSVSSIHPQQETAESLPAGITAEQNSSSWQGNFSSSQTEIFSEHLDYERKNLLPEEKTKIIIKSNVPNAEVFLNGNFEGNTNLTLNNLTPGRYRLRVEKSGYRPKYYRIDIAKGEERTFYIELEKYTGTVTFVTAQEDTAIYADHSQITGNSAILDEGTHTIQAKKFGWKTETASIYVPRNSFQVVTVNLTKADFSISGFRPSKNRFNPSLKGSAGKIKFTFDVSTFEHGIFSVTDSFGNTVTSKNLPYFTTWGQSVTWDGTTDGSKKIPDGQYTATVEAGGQKVSAVFHADSSIKLPQAGITAGGSGLGILPAAFTFPEKTLVWGVDAGAVAALKNKTFCFSPISTFFSYGLSKNAEISARAGIKVSSDDCFAFINSALKVIFSRKNDGFDLNWGFLLRAGADQTEPFFPCGADRGTGLGGGLVFGLDFAHFFAGISSEFTFAPSTFDTKNGKYDKVLRNGLSLQLKGQAGAFAIYGAVNTSWGTTGLAGDDRSSNSAEPVRAVDAGFELKIPATDTLHANLRANAQIFKNQTYFSSEAGISILF